MKQTAAWDNMWRINPAKIEIVTLWQLKIFERSGGSDSGVTDDPCLLGCDAVSVGEWF